MKNTGRRDCRQSHSIAASRSGNSWGGICDGDTEHVVALLYPRHATGPGRADPRICLAPAHPAHAGVRCGDWARHSPDGERRRCHRHPGGGENSNSTCNTSRHPARTHTHNSRPPTAAIRTAWGVSPRITDPRKTTKRRIAASRTSDHITTQRPVTQHRTRRAKRTLSERQVQRSLG